MARRDYRDRNGDKLPGVTTVLEVLGLNKRTLMAWANRIGREGRKIGRDGRTLDDREANRGALVHALLEAELVERADLRETAIADCDVSELDHATKLAQAAAKKVREIGDVVAVELALVDDDPVIGFGGTLDVVVRELEKRHLVIVDLKTGGSVYGEVRVQLGAYGMLHERHGRGRFARGAIVHAPWDGDGSARVHDIAREHLDRGAMIFGMLRTIYAQREHLEGRIAG